MRAIATVMCLLFTAGLSASLVQARDEAVEESSVPAQEEALPEHAAAVDDRTDEEDGTSEVAREQPERSVVLMDSRWAGLACEAWNEDSTLTDDLAAPGWVANNKDRGYKVIQLYRTDCESSPWVELHIADQDGKALCVYGGSIETEELLGGVDYIMHALTQRWQEMGAGDYGPMKGMITGRLKFTGPKWEAMKNMGPFTSFLRLAGAVPSDASTCPEGADAGD